MLHTVTITGLDVWTNRNALVDLQREFPFVEWGILLSASRMGQDNRYPPSNWIEDTGQFFASVPVPPRLRLSGHLCGAWARDIAAGGNRFVTEYPKWPSFFRRLQLNVGHILSDISSSTEYGNDGEHFYDGVRLLAAAHPTASSRIIIQVNPNQGWRYRLQPLLDEVDILFDCSGGRGIVAEHWPNPVAGTDARLLTNCGYAGGLTPDNLPDQLALIMKASLGQPIWIDVESGVRTDNYLDLDKVRQFLTVAKAARTFLADV